MVPPPKRKPTRMREYDYSRSGWYFLTLCTKNRIEWFGDVTDGKMILNEYGRVAEEQWLWLARQYDHVKLDEFVIMPNHIHAILVIADEGARRDNPGVVPTGYSRRHNLLSKSVNAFKTTTSKLIHQHGLSEFVWERSFYDHIIRKDESLRSIREYIANNPIRWHLDRDNPENLLMPVTRRHVVEMPSRPSR
jgi:putative transposase